MRLWFRVSEPASYRGSTYRHRKSLCLAREGEALWMFLDVPGVEATNNTAERAHRCGVLWRKRSQGTCSEKGNRWVERILSVRHTCRIRGRPTFPLLVDAVACLFKGERPDLSWITQHVSSPLPSTPSSDHKGAGRGRTH